MAKKRTINLMISEDADTRLRALSAELKLAMGAIIEQAILQWRPDTATPIECMPITDAIEARFNALESRLAALEAMGAVKIGAVGIEAVDVACEPVDITAAAKKKALSDTELDAVVRDYLKRSGNKIIPAGDLMRQDGISFSQKRLIESRDRIVVADRIKATLER